MNAPNNVRPVEMSTMSTVSTVPTEEPVWAPRTAVRRRRVVVNVLRVLVLVVVIGGWELATRLRWVDPFFFGQPSLIWSQIVTWATKGTAQGPLWQQIAVTVEETVLGFLIGVVLGVIFGI